MHFAAAVTGAGEWGAGPPLPPSGKRGPAKLPPQTSLATCAPSEHLCVISIYFVRLVGKMHNISQTSEVRKGVMLRAKLDVIKPLWQVILGFGKAHR